jgi:hypothetical protein
LRSSHARLQRYPDYAILTSKQNAFRLCLEETVSENHM